MSRKSLSISHCSLCLTTSLIFNKWGEVIVLFVFLNASRRPRLSQFDFQPIISPASFSAFNWVGNSRSIALIADDKIVSKTRTPCIARPSTTAHANLLCISTDHESTFSWWSVLILEISALTISELMFESKVCSDRYWVKSLTISKVILSNSSLRLGILRPFKMSSLFSSFSGFECSFNPAVDKKLLTRYLLESM